MSIFVALVMASSCFVGGPEPEVDQVREAARAAWKEYLVFGRELQGTESLCIYSDQGSVTMITEARHNGTCVLGRIRNERRPTGITTPSWDETVWLLNSAYSAELRRDSTKDQWQLTRLVARSMGIPEVIRFALGVDSSGTREDKGVPFSLRVSPEGTSIVDVFNDAHTQIESVRRQNHIMTINLKYFDRARGWTTGTVELDTSRYWLPISYSLQSKIEAFRAEHRFTNYTHPPLCIGATWSVSSVDAERGIRAEGKAEIVIDKSIPAVLPSDAEFTLSAFGLPEPYGIEWERPTPWWLYAEIAAGVLLVVIFLLGLWKRRLLART